jgi:hypothetical protein
LVRTYVEQLASVAVGKPVHTVRRSATGGEHLAGVAQVRPALGWTAPTDMAPVDVVVGRCVVPLVENATATWLLPTLTAEPTVEHLVGVAEATRVSSYVAPEPMT